MFYKFKLDRSVVEAAKNIYCTKGEDRWSQYSNQRVLEILLGLQKPQQLSKVR